VTAAHPVAGDVSVVIPTVGRALLEGCLESISAGTVWPAALIVVDQGASPSVAGWVERLRARGLNARHVPSAETGIAAGTNRGLGLVRTRFVAVTHDDCRVRTEWLATMAALLREAGEVVLTGRVEPEGDGEVPTTVTLPRRTVYTRPLLDRDVLFPANMGLPVTVLERVGPLDEDPLLRWAAEDNDWAYRALRSGVPIVYDPALVVGHLAWRDDAELAATYRRYARAQGCFYGKWLRRGDRFIALRAARDLVRGPWLVLRGLVTRNQGLTAMGRAELAGIGPGILAGLRGPRRS
jgi:GT2 family glycosyltransferase